MDATATREYPILFRPELVRKILDGKKTQTRRPVKFKVEPATVVGRNEEGELDNAVPRPMPDWQVEALIADCPFGQVGDVLWVRETWGAGWADGCGGYSALCPSGCDRKKPDKYFYLADGWDESQGKHCWRPSIHMPKEACRLRLEITDVRVERVQSISEADAVAEGMEPWVECWAAHPLKPQSKPRFMGARRQATCAEAFEQAWNAAYPGSWDRNEWVWAITFKALA